MGTAADDLRDNAEQLWEEHLLKQCVPEDCPYCQRLNDEEMPCQIEMIEDDI